MDPRAQHTTTESQLHHILNKRCNIPELRTFCFDLDIDHENLPGDTKIEKAIGLVSYLARHNRLSDLVELGQKRRPDITWSSKCQFSANTTWIR